MQTIRTPLLAMALLALAPLTAAAQTKVIAGTTTMSFDHDAASATDTDRYELCVDGATTCTPLTVARVGTTDEYRFTLPASVPRGTRNLVVRAVWLGGAVPGDAVSFRAVVAPGKPSPVRAGQ